MSAVSASGSVRQWYWRYRQQVFAVALSILRDEAAARDVAQETFLRALRHARRVPPMEKPYPWLRRIAANLCIDRQRRDWIASRAELDPTLHVRPAPESEHDPGHALWLGQLRQQLALGIGRLSPAHREVLVMRDVEELSYQQIADECGCPRGTVMSRLFYARRQLRRILQPALTYRAPLLPGYLGARGDPPASDDCPRTR